MNSQKAISSFFYSLILLDLMIIPYLQIIIIPLSLIPVAWLFSISRDGSIHDTDFRIFVAIVICATLSTAFSPFFLNDENYIINNIKYLVQLISSFFYFFVFKSISKNNETNFNIIIIPIYIFITWYTILLLFYFSDPYTTTDLLKNIYGRTTVEYSDFLNDLRFPYLFSDPNTAIYFYLLGVSFLNFLRPSLKNLIILILGGGLATLAAQSTGGIMAYLVILIWIIINFMRIKIVNILPYALVIFIIGIIFFSFLSELEYFQNLQTLSLDRLSNEDRYSGGGGRMYHWSNVMSLTPWPLGRGYTLYSEGNILPPHSDILGTIYRYGFLSTILFANFLFFRDKRFTVFSVAIIVPFAINAVIEDQKIFALYLALIGYTSGIRERQLVK